MSRQARRFQAHAWRLAPFAHARAGLFTLFCLLAFSLQSYVAATHIHEAVSAHSGIAAQSGDASPVQLAGKAAAKGDHNRVPTHENECPLCRAVVHAGAFLFPGLLIVEVPGDGVVLARAAIVSEPASSAVSHSWRSRGPPRL